MQPSIFWIEPHKHTHRRKHVLTANTDKMHKKDSIAKQNKHWKYLRLLTVSFKMYNQFGNKRKCTPTATNTHRQMNGWRESHWHLTCSESGTWEVGWPAFPYPWPWTVSSRPVRSTAARQFLLLCRGEKTQTHTHHDWQTVGGGHITNNTSPHACLQSSHTGMEVSVKKKKLGFYFYSFHFY